MPEPNTEIFLYQTLIGTWPLIKDDVPHFKERLKAYMLKAAKEAKDHTNWLSPNSDYENALIAFVDSVLDGSGQNHFFQDFLPFVQRIAYYGALNSLAQVLLKVASLGAPDLYQGTELWDLSLVDPDNRRPVNFGKRKGLLDSIIKQESHGQQSLVKEMLGSWEDGRVKLYVTCKALNTRKSYKEVFQEGVYIPLQVAGQKQEHVVAFARRRNSVWTLVVVPRLITKLVDFGTFPIGRKVWGDDLLLLPEDTPQRWHNSFTGETLTISGARKALDLSDILCMFPIALLINI